MGRALDNICIERFWRTIKYEEIYLNEYKSIKQLRKAIEIFMKKYNKRRLHSTLDYQTENNLDAEKGKLLPLVS